jgi:thiosulfate dehydrogenase
MSQVIISILMMLLMGAMAWGQEPADHPPEQYDRKDFTEDIRISRGGQLYDNWWKTKVNIDKPSQDHPLWKLQSTNQRSGYSTWRCKECHGWDYRGKEGAYSKGSHYTGYQGVYEVTKELSVKDIEATLRGSTNSEHDFSKYLSDEDISDLALFLKKGTADMAVMLNTEGDYEEGLGFYRTNCMTECHGPEGTWLNFGNEEKPQYIGTIANKNPWEFVHKARAGQPGSRMSSGIISGWSDNDMRNLLMYAQTLPAKAPEPRLMDRIKEMLGLSKKQNSHISKEFRGFGPKRTE